MPRMPSVSATDTPRGAEEAARGRGGASYVPEMSPHQRELRQSAPAIYRIHHGERVPAKTRKTIHKTLKKTKTP